MRKRILTLFLIVCLFANMLTGITLGVSAEATSEQAKPVARVNGKDYTDYREAWKEVKNGGTIDMLDTWGTNEMLTVENGAEVTINMNGHMINRCLTLYGYFSGEIFLVKPNATLNIVGGDKTVPHYGTLLHFNVWQPRDEHTGYYRIDGAVLTGGHNLDGGGGIHMQKGATVNVSDVTFAGNISYDTGSYTGGGAIRVQGENGTLNVSDSTFCFNYGKGGGGGAVWVEGKDSSINITNTVFHNNYTSFPDGDGGVFQIENGTTRLTGCSFYYNESTHRNGGAIYIRNGNLIIDETTLFSHNSAGKEGGAIYVDGDADNVEIRGIFSGNTAEEEGGAVYINNNINNHKGVKISDAKMLGNSSNGNGGAVYVDADDDVSLSGKVIMNGNSPNNLYIKKQTSIYSNELTEGSRIGLYTSWGATADKAVSSGNYQYFYSDMLGYEIMGEDGKIYFVESDATKTPNEYIVGDVQYPIQKGEFTFKSKLGEESNSYYFYSDGYFAEPAELYNEHLSSMSFNLAFAASVAKYEGDYTPAKASKNIKALLTSLGFTDIEIHYPMPEYFGPDAEHLSTIGYAIAKKTIEINGKPQTLVVSVVRGGGYGAEWASNMTLGVGFGEAKGFSDAADQVEAALKRYISSKNIDTNNAKFWMTGFSRGAVTTNLVAKRFTDLYGADKIYAYCFETPQGGVHTEIKLGEHYSNLHNIINASDIVPFVGPSEMGFIRYGVDHIIPSGEVGSGRYNEQKKLMLKQLEQLTPGLEFKDRFQEATIEYLANYLGITDLISENWITFYNTAREWIPSFFEQVQRYSMCTHYSATEEEGQFNINSIAWHGYRNYWANYKWYLYSDDNGMYIKSYAVAPEDADTVNYAVVTLEQSVANLAKFYFGSTGEKKEKIKSALDYKELMSRISLSNVYFNIIGEWHKFSIDEKNSHFNKLWNDLKLEDEVKDILSPSEMTMIKESLFVVLDVLLDFISHDYRTHDQDYLGTLLNNIPTILQSHYFDVTCSWVRSYDSYYTVFDNRYCEFGNHTYGNWTITREATESEPGIKTQVCSECGVEHVEEIPRTLTGNGVWVGAMLNKGSILSIICMSVTLIGCATSILLYVKIVKKPQKESEE